MSLARLRQGRFRMKTPEEQTIDTLNTLIEVCRDGQEGFKIAAQHAKGGELSQLFLTYSGERGKYVRELQNQVAKIGGTHERPGSVSGTLHRGWLNLKSAITSDDPQALLVECERGEEAAASAYRAALRTALDPETLEIVARQARRVQITHSQVKQLLEGVAYARP